MPARAEDQADNKGDRLAALMKRSVGERIVIAGRQRMLAEGMAAKLCYKVSGIQNASAGRDLYTMWNIFGWYHAGLRHGNTQLELSAESNLDVLNAWAQMDLIWGGLKGVYEGVIDSDTSDRGTLGVAVDLTEAVTDGASQLVATLRGAYSEQLGPQGFGSALLIDLYERQRMLGQKIAKDVCLVSLRDTPATRIAGLEKTLTLFNLSLDAFQNGLSDVGVPPPPTPEIAQLLKKARKDWQPAETWARAAAEGQALSQTELADFADAMDLFISDMTAAINALVAFKAR
ncbi:MAG: type IV pili methyl-accepting chemotaxis transducer N-terminal domain-containing protein [Paracoccaceae bacterium]